MSGEIAQLLNAGAKSYCFGIVRIGEQISNAEFSHYSTSLPKYDANLDRGLVRFVLL